MSDFAELSLQASCGNQAAADFLTQVVQALHLWDDLIDQDKVIDTQIIHEVFINLLTVLPHNPFFKNQAPNLTPVLLMAIQNWRLANQVECSDASHSTELEVAFVLRSSYVDLVTMTATLCGGYEHGLKVAAQVRKLAHREGYPQYLINLAHEKLMRSQEQSHHVL